MLTSKLYTTGLSNKRSLIINILVTGGSGFVGWNLTWQLLEEGHEVWTTGKPTKENPLDLSRCLGYSFHDLNWQVVSDNIRNSLPPIDVVFHQAALNDTTHEPESDYYEVNVRQAIALFEGAYNAGCRQFIYASSCAVYGASSEPFQEFATPSPLNAYGESKALFDEFAMQCQSKVTALRYSNVYGLGEKHKGKSASMIYQLARQMNCHQRPKLFKWGHHQRDFVHIDDVVRANLLALNAPGGIYNVGSGIPTSFNEVVKILNEECGTHLEPEYIDNPYEAVYQNYTCVDLTKSREILGYEPQVSIKEGIHRYLLII